MRFACGILLGVAMTLLLAAATTAWIQSPSAWTAAAAATMALLSTVIWAGFGRALYDVFWANRDARG
jgi:hypothetical protein